MKKLLSFLIFTFCVLSFAWPVFAQNNDNISDTANQGVLSSMARETNPQKVPQLEKKPKARMFTQVIVDVKYDDTHHANNRADEYSQTTGRIRLFNKIWLTDSLSLNTRATVKGIDNAGENARRSADSHGGGDRTFENTGVILRELNLVWDQKNYALMAGKFNLNFGNAWMWNRGLWIHDLANNYRQMEKLGFSGIYRLGNSSKTGQYNFSFSSFTNDRKNLDNSLLVNRDSDHKSDATPGDTGSLQSYNAALDVIFDFAPKERLTYHFAFLNLAVNGRASAVAQDKIADQQSYVLNMNYKYPLPQDMGLEAFVEYVNTINLNGNSNYREKYLTLNLIAKLDKNWSILTGNSNRQQVELGGDGYDQRLTEISLGYEFPKTDFFDKLTIQGGFRSQRNNPKTSIDKENGVGLLLRYYKDF